MERETERQREIEREILKGARKQRE